MKRLIKYVQGLFANRVFAATFLFAWIVGISFLPNLSDLRLGAAHFVAFAMFFIAGVFGIQISERFKGDPSWFLKSLIIYLLIVPLALLPLVSVLAYLVSTRDATATFSVNFKAGLVSYSILGLIVMLVSRLFNKAEAS